MNKYKIGVIGLGYVGLPLAVEFAKIFEKYWRANVGYSDLIFTQSIEGRRLLLKSRIASLSANLSDTKKEKSEKVYRWR